MKAVILAAGEGKRLRPLTDEIPKPMVRVGGKPILEHTLNTLPDIVTEVILVIGYRKEAIQEYFGDSFSGRKLIYVEQPEPKGPGEALLRARPFLDSDPFFVIYADDLYHPEDLAACIKGTPCVLVKESENPERFGVCQVTDDGRLLEVLEKRKNPPTNLVNIGVYFLTHDIFSIPPIFLPNGEHNLAEQIGVMAQKHPVYIERARFWHPIGYPEDVVAAEEWLSLPVEQRLN